MTKYIVCPAILLVVCCLSLPTHAQRKQGLVMYRTFGGAEFEYTKDTTTFYVSPKQVSAILKEDPLAYAEFKKARQYNGVSGVMGFVGGSLVVLPVVTAIAGGESEWGLAIGGAVLIAGSIPFHRAFKRHAQNAIDTYNKNHTAFRPKAEYSLYGAGIRILVKF